MSRQVNQKPISVRLDYAVLSIADQEAFISGIPRNRIINDALKLYVYVAETRRRYRMYCNLKEFDDHMRAVHLDPDTMP